MLTSLGKFMRKLRIDNGEILRDMARKLEVSSAFLSAVENGKKKIPASWTAKLADIYSLTNAQIAELDEAIIESKDVIELNIKNTTNPNRELAICFARKFDDLDEITSTRILRILKKNKEE